MMHNLGCFDKRRPMLSEYAYIRPVSSPVKLKVMLA